MSTPLVIVQGSTRQWVPTIRANGKAMTGVFIVSDVLSAKVWAGGNQPTLFTPSVAWVTPSAATYALTITSANVAGLTAGTYKLEVGVTPASDGVYRVVLSCTIKVLESAGSNSALVSYITFDDVINYARDSKQVLDLANSDREQTGFAIERNRAYSMFNTAVLRRYNPAPGRSKRYMNADLTAPGPYLQLAPSPDGSLPPSRATLLSYLVSGRLILNEDVIEANARMAAALIYGPSPGQGNPFTQLAAQEMKLAGEALDRANVMLDAKVSPDGNATIQIERDVIYLT